MYFFNIFSILVVAFSMIDYLNMGMCPTSEICMPDVS